MTSITFICGDKKYSVYIEASHPFMKNMGVTTDVIPDIILDFDYLFVGAHNIQCKVQTTYSLYCLLLLHDFLKIDMTYLLIEFESQLNDFKDDETIKYINNHNVNKLIRLQELNC